MKTVTGMDFRLFVRSSLTGYMAAFDQQANDIAWLFGLIKYHQHLKSMMDEYMDWADEIGDESKLETVDMEQFLKIWDRTGEDIVAEGTGVKKERLKNITVYM